MRSSLPLHRQRGITLIESLVAIVVAALGILGILGVQMRTLTDTQTTVRRAQAIRLIEDLSERLKAHPNSLMSLGSYAHVGTNAPVPAPSVNCATTACNGTQLTTYDVTEWVRAVQRSLPQGDADIFLAPGDDATNPRQLGVMISWRENERADADAAYSASINAIAGGGGGGTCPAKRTCHLQYIPVSARCAPYRAGGASARQPYCAGA
ncbi:MAG: type IV pilus modification protein PilV [Proteobacteria bacterium]|nr:type IV pilus modification protein PilV [Pseudomonadota bacterium]